MFQNFILLNLHFWEIIKNGKDLFNICWQKTYANPSKNILGNLL
jgi:hypothetical protein